MSNLNEERTRRRSHLVERERVPPQDADAFLDVLELLAESNPEFHAAIAAELDGRMLRADAGAAADAREALVALSSLRDSRAGPGDVRAAVGLAARAAGRA